MYVCIYVYMCVCVYVDMYMELLWIYISIDRYHISQSWDKPISIVPWLYQYSLYSEQVNLPVTWICP